MNNASSFHLNNNAMLYLLSAVWKTKHATLTGKEQNQILLWVQYYKYEIKIQVLSNISTSWIATKWKSEPKLRKQVSFWPRSTEVLQCTPCCLVCCLNLRTKVLSTLFSSQRDSVVEAGPEPFCRNSTLYTLSTWLKVPEPCLFLLDDRGPQNGGNMLRNLFYLQKNKQKNSL